MDYSALFELAATYLAGALYVREAERLRALAEAPIFSSDEQAVEIIARYSALLEEALEEEEEDGTGAVDMNEVRARGLAELRGEVRR